MDIRTYQVAVNNAKGNSTDQGGQSENISYKYKRFSDDFIDKSKIDEMKTTAILTEGCANVKRLENNMLIDFSTDKYVNWQESNMIALNNKKIIIPNSIGVETPQIQARYVSSLIKVPDTTSISINPDDNMKTVEVLPNAISFENNAWVKAEKDPYGRLWVFYLDVRDIEEGVDYSYITPMQAIKYIVYDTDDTVLKQGMYVSDYVGYTFCFGADVCFDDECNAYLTIPVKCNLAAYYPVPYGVSYINNNGSANKTSQCSASNEEFPKVSSYTYARGYGFFLIKFDLFNQAEGVFDIKVLYAHMKSKYYGSSSYNFALHGFYATYPKVKFNQGYIYMLNPSISCLGGSSTSVGDNYGYHGYPLKIIDKKGNNKYYGFTEHASTQMGSDYFNGRRFYFNYKEWIFHIRQSSEGIGGASSFLRYEFYKNGSTNMDAFALTSKSGNSNAYTLALNSGSNYFYMPAANGGIYGYVFDSNNHKLYLFCHYSNSSVTEKEKRFKFVTYTLNESTMQFSYVTSVEKTLNNYMYNYNGIHAGIDAKYLIDGSLIHVIYPGYIKGANSWALMYMCISTSGDIVTQDTYVYQKDGDLVHNFDIYKKENGEIEVIFGVGGSFNSYSGDKGNIYKATIYGREDATVTDIKYSIFSKQDNAWYDVNKNQVIDFVNPTDTIKIKADLISNRWATTPELNNIGISCVKVNNPSEQLVVSKSIEELDNQISGTLCLSAVENPNGGNIKWEKTFDGGNTWVEMLKNTEYDMLPENVIDLKVRATLTPSVEGQGDPYIDSYTLTKKETVQVTQDSALAEIRETIAHMNGEIDSISSNVDGASLSITNAKSSIDTVVVENQHLKQDVANLSSKIDQLHTLI